MCKSNLQSAHVWKYKLRLAALGLEIHLAKFLGGSHGASRETAERSGAASAWGRYEAGLLAGR